MREEYSSPILVEYPPLTDVTGGSIEQLSDINRKALITPIDQQDVLNRVVSLPISSWAYKQDPDVRHIGPMAQDFHSAFGVGKDDKTIFNIDAQGVAIAAIQGLYELVEQKDAEIARQRDQLAALEARLAQLEQKLH